MRARLATALLLASLGLAACSSDEPDEALPALPPVTEAPSPTPDAVPSEAAEATPEGAAEFAKLFYAEVARGFQTANPNLVADLSSDACETCTKYVDSIQAVRDQGWRAQGGDFEIVFAVAPAVEGDTATVDVGWNFAPVRYLDETGNVAEEGPAVTGVEEQLTLTRTGSSWQVMQVQRIRQRQ